jgi:hypothetical protein
MIMKNIILSTVVGLLTIFTFTNALGCTAPSPIDVGGGRKLVFHSNNAPGCAYHTDEFHCLPSFNQNIRFTIYAGDSGSDYALFSVSAGNYIPNPNGNNPSGILQTIDDYCALYSPNTWK